jgi:uncharacterized membrane protein YgdD (TMEM256/DUF423 family)
MSRLLWVTGAVFGLAAVAAGAFGAHALRERLSEQALGTFETAARYHMYHALAILGAAWLAERAGGGAAAWAGLAFGVGVLIFSGSLYLLALTGVRWLGAITPVGGVALLGGWALLAIAGWRAL